MSASAFIKLPPVAVLQQELGRGSSWAQAFTSGSASGWIMPLSASMAVSTGRYRRGGPCPLKAVQEQFMAQGQSQAMAVGKS